MSATVASKYIESILAPGDVVPLKTLLSRLDRAPPEAKRYFQRYCKNLPELQTFLTDDINSEYFIVENKKVALFDVKISEVRQMTEDYYELKVRKSGEALHYMDLKNNYSGEALDEVMAFIARFYPAGEFKHFFTSRSHLFILRKEKVFLIESECVKFFKDMIKRFGPGELKSVRGYIGQAKPHIQTYVNEYCWGDDFRFFLEKHSNVFKVDDVGNVTLLDSF